jgi:RNA polymerase sigma factor (sigma-70 family)
MTTEPTVFVVDDDAAMRSSLRWLVESVGLRVEEFSSAREFLDQGDLNRAGCLVLDIRMPETNGLELQAELGDRDCHLPVLVVTGYADVPSVVRAMKVGAIDVLQKPCSDKDLMERIQQAIDLDAKRRETRQQRTAFRQRLATLTAREREVLDLVVVGRSSKWVAQSLQISEKTVEVHRSHILKKLEVGGVAELVRLVTLTEQSEHELAGRAAR